MATSRIAARVAVLAGLLTVLHAQEADRVAAIRPEIPATVSPLERVTPIAHDGEKGLGFLRKPPGPGPFPAVLLVHPGMTNVPEPMLREYVLRAAPPSRFLTAGYVTLTVTYRSRDLDPQSKAPVDDVRAALDALRGMKFVDPRSIGLFGCSGGADLALEVLSGTDAAAVVAEEPATMMFVGAFNTRSPKAGARYTPADAAPIMANPFRHYTQDYQNIARRKIDTIHTPLLIIQGDDASPLNRWNAAVLLPELRRARKDVTVMGNAGEPHCFAWDGRAPFGPAGEWRHRPPAALKAYTRAEQFLRARVATQPKPIDIGLVTFVPLEGK